MENEIKITKNWWLLTILGIVLTALGIWVYSNPVENYVALSITFSVIMLLSGILEISFALSNSKRISGWGWIFSGGVFDLVLGLVLLSKPEISMAFLPIYFGIWLVFRGITQLGKGFLLKDMGLNWGWTVFGGILVIIFGFLVVSHPLFGAMSIVVWTALSLIVLGIFTLLFSFILKKIKE